MRKFLLQLWRDERGAVTVTPTLSGKAAFACTVIATADADVTTGNIAHGLPAAPLISGTTQIRSQAPAPMPTSARATVNTTHLTTPISPTTRTPYSDPQILT